MKEPGVFDAAVDVMSREKFREMLRKLRGDNRNLTSDFSVMVTSGPERLTDEQLDGLKNIMLGYLPADLLETTTDLELMATAIAGRSVKIY